MSSTPRLALHFSKVAARLDWRYFRDVSGRLGAIAYAYGIARCFDHAVDQLQTDTPWPVPRLIASQPISTSP
jgi:hypothetical protein